MKKWINRSVILFILLLLLTACRAGNPTSFQNPQSVRQQFRYSMLEAGEVFFVWGVDGWQVLPDGDRPPGTEVRNNVMHTPMVAEGGSFVVTLRASAGTKLDYGFLITKRSDGAVIEPLWDGREDYSHIVDERDQIIDLHSKVSLSEEPAPANLIGKLVEQEFRYHMPEAGEVFLIWGIDGWGVLSESLYPRGTQIKNKVMHTPMTYDRETFSTTVLAPEGSRIDYGFLITKSRMGYTIPAVWDEQVTSPTPPIQGEKLVEVESQLTLQRTRGLAGLLKVLLYIALGIGALVGFYLSLLRLPRDKNRKVFIIGILITLTLLGLTLRMWKAATTERLLTTPATLIGDERRYDELAMNFLGEGQFFYAGSVPVYPLFLAGAYALFGHSFAAVIYIQALIGALAIPLTFWLGRYFLDDKGSLFATGLVAVQPNLIGHVSYLYTEALYTVLFLLTLLCMSWTLKSPGICRFLLAGIILGVSTLCRPASALLPVVILFLLPSNWKFAQRVLFTIVYTWGMLIVIAPWTYSNYRQYQTFLPFGLSLTTLWQGSPEFYHVMETKENAIVTVWEEELNPEWNGGHDPMTIEGDRYFNARALASIRAEPGVYFWYFLKKMVYFWAGHPASTLDWPFNLHLISIFLLPWQIAEFFGGRLVLILLALASLLILVGKLKSFSLLLGVSVYFMLVYAVLIPLARHSEPIYPVLAILISAAAGALATRSRVNRRYVQRAGMSA